MKTIKSTVECTYVRPSIKDVLVMSPLIDKLKRELSEVRKVAIYKALSEQDKAKYYTPYSNSGFTHSELINILEVLDACGFISIKEYDEELDVKL